MTRRDFRTPSTVPDGYITRCITIPASQEWLGLVNAALLMLTEPWRYTQVFDTDLTPAETAAIAFDMYVAYLTGCEVDMECSDVIACMLPYIQAQQIAGGVVRLDPVTDEPQVSYDGGVTWSDVPQSPQPVQTPTPTPTPGSDDTARICLASTRAALIIAEFYSQTFGAFTADLLNTLNGINQFLHSINTALYNLIYSPYEGILEAAGWFDFDFTTNYTAATLTGEQIQDITCLLTDNATVDGSGVVTFDHAAVQAALVSVLGVNPGTAVTLNVSNMRSEGLQAASQVNVVSSADCSFCGETDWCYEFNFLTGTQGWSNDASIDPDGPTATAVYDAGSGWKDLPASAYDRVFIRSPLFTAADIVRVELEFAGGGLSGGQPQAQIYQQGVGSPVRAGLMGTVATVGPGTLSNPVNISATHSTLPTILRVAWDRDSTGVAQKPNTYLEKVRVYGNGATNPFGMDNCT